MFTSSLTLVDHLSYDYIRQLSDSMLDRFCLQILPEIHHKIKQLDVEVLSMKRILLSTNYPNLSEIALYNIQIERAVHLFSSDIFDFDSFADKYIKGIC